MRLIEREAILLEKLKDFISVQIPEPLYVDISDDNPHMGYQKLPGASLTRYYHIVPAAKRRSIGETAGRFLGELHELNLHELWVENSDPVFDVEADRNDYRAVFNRIQKEVYPNLSESQIEWTDVLFHEFLEPDENFDYEPCLTHGDFDTSNILVNPKTFEVTGIIDFEETRMYDPAADFLFQDGGVDFLAAILGSYTRKTDEKLPQRMTFRLGRQPFIYILSGIDFKLERMVSYGYAALDEMIREWNRYSSVLSESFATLKL